MSLSKIESPASGVPNQDLRYSLHSLNKQKRLCKSHIMAVQQFGVGSYRSNIPKEQAKAANFDYDSPVWIESGQRERVEYSIAPENSISDGGPIRFSIPAEPDSYLNMNTINLYTKVKFCRDDGTNLTDEDIISPINFLGTTLWKRVEIQLNNRPVPTANSAEHANYKGYLELLLSYEEATAECSYLRTQLLYMDEPAKFHKTAITGNQDNINKGFVKRHNIIKSSGAVDVIGPLIADFLRSSTHLAPGNSLQIALTRASDDFIIMGAAALPSTYTMKILEMRLHYSRIRVKESIPKPLIERYKMTRTELVPYHVYSGATNYTETLLTNGPLPHSLIIAQVHTDFFEGTRAMNPLTFDSMYLKAIDLKLNGKSITGDALTCDLEADPVLMGRLYHHVFLNSGCYQLNKGNFLKPSRFLRGSFVVPYDFSPDHCHSWHNHESKTGTLELSMQWSKALEKNITILVYSAWNEMVIKKAGESTFTTETV